MLFTAPLLDKPAPGWKRDLPSPDQPSSCVPYPPVLPNAPNHLDSTYMELPRCTLSARGIGVWLAIFVLGLSVLLLTAPLIFPLAPGESIDWGFILVCLGLSVVLIWFSIHLWRMDVKAPRDEPIRFNRLRRKVYVYRFHHDGLRPFSRTAWGVRTEVYDWDDLRAEVSSVYSPMGTGGLVESVSIAVVKPGTCQVRERFHFAHGTMQGEMYWAMAQLFMQQGPQALPHFPRPPRDWNNEDVSFNLARRLAPKVHWPAKMDLESRTGP
ncbi:DUF6708 domain-containing protein [Stenotrophomonas sp.]|uniref:DUF6708 domain-containing protein n=1 Tax=Stenotrophomonas sp. TaxID=69392 RepID=UPI0029A23DA0|nr:DUF6708 domain-containing protein [Stenotrophomonas sp.]MDX3936652.1 hypothetical protein [Stenotrophomonas sp.]